MWETLLNLLFPKQCLGCGIWGEYFCPECLNLVSITKKKICPMCNMPSYAGLPHPNCHRQYGLDGLISVFSYKGVVKKAITRLKYKFVTDMAKPLIELFLSTAGEDKIFTRLINQKPILVPVPLYWQKKNWRGFNQAELLGKVICQNLKIGYMPDLLIRTKNTTPQVGLKKEERLNNLKGAFQINPKYPNILIRRMADYNILIFDDVWTTGSTIRECAKALKQQGVKQAWGLTLALD